MKFTYSADDLFEDIEGDSENVLMNLPQEVMDAAGLVPGDSIVVEMGDKGSILIKKVINGEQE